jgi:mono/diheme cytochrome c family protein
MRKRIFRPGLSWTCIVGLLGLATIGLGSSALCQNTAEHDYNRLCASCHGIDGSGKGRDLTEANPPDLTQLSRNHGGEFPFAEVYRSVDGREMKGSHKRFAMPFWGDYLQKQGAEYTPGSNAAVEQTITAIVRYVEHLQKK